VLIIPAIDIKDGKCVRLRQGRMNEETIFSDDPVAMARRWVDVGARRLHIVDLNGAHAGKPVNAAAIQAIRSAFPDMPMQVGGGIRDEDTIQAYIDMGVRYVILGTKAVNAPHFVSDVCTEFPGHIIVGLDAKDGKVAIDGWSKLSGHDVIDLAKKYQDDGVEAIIYTDIGRDGMMSGVNIEATVKLAQALHIPVIASGGIASLKDIKALCAVQDEGISGAEQGRLGWRPEPRRGALGQRGELRLAKPRIRGGDLDVLAPLVGTAGQPSGTQDEDLTGMDRQRALEQEVIGEDDPATEQAWVIGQGAHDIQDLSEAAWSFKAGPQLGVPLGERERGDARRGQALCGHWSPRLRVGLS